jgi:ADP-dependent NAD(P)H-hydrate dehydratase / NAD(P)H-hydrate epimerase
MSIPVLSIAEMRDWEERTWRSGVLPEAVIRRVGDALAVQILDQTRPGDRVLLVAGRGNNGADVRASAPHLTERVVELVEVKDPVADFPALTQALERNPDLVVDGLFGIGLNRELGEAWCRCLRTLNDSGRPILSMDVPSGLNADTGGNWGAVVMAGFTLTVGASKRGLLAPSAWNAVGRLQVASGVGLVGMPEGEDGRDWVLAGDFHGFPPRRLVDSHKGSLGKAVVLAGSLGFSGAAVLATRAAGRARPGLLAALVPQEVQLPVSMTVPSAMVHPFAPDHPVLARASAVLAGPGLAAPDLSPAVKSEVLRLWRTFHGVMVVDASALAWLADLPYGGAPGLRVLTPHPGEAAGLLDCAVTEVQADRPAALRKLARRYQSIVVLKGHQTLVGGASGRIRVNSSGNPGLAQGGSGDVLGGFLTGLLAQPHLQLDPLKTVAYAVWEHGRAADRLEAQSRHWISEDLANEIGR